MIFGTHNSGTGGELVWWLKPFAWIINLTSKCQNKSIKQQLKDGVKLFNLLIAYYKGEWRFSHGLALYKENVLETIKLLRLKATPLDPIYFQLYLDNSFWVKQNKKEFEKLVNVLKLELCCPYFVMLSAWIEGTNKYLHKSSSKITIEERYWTLGYEGLSWLDELPLPKYHAKKYNTCYINDCESDYLMLDFYNL